MYSEINSGNRQNGNRMENLQAFNTSLHLTESLLRVKCLISCVSLTCQMPESLSSDCGNTLPYDLQQAFVNH